MALGSDYLRLPINRPGKGFILMMARVLMNTTIIDDFGKWFFKVAGNVRVSINPLGRADWNSAGPQIFGTESLSSAPRPTPNASANAPDAGSCA